LEFRRVLFRSRYGPLYNDENAIFGFADSGAHINSMAFYNFPLRVLRYVQASHEQGKPLMSIEKAVHRLTGENADFFNLDAGHLVPGARADVVVVDPARLTDDVHEITSDTFLGGHRRLVNRRDEAVRLVVVGGRPAWENGAPVPAFGRERFGRFLPGAHDAR